MTEVEFQLHVVEKLANLHTQMMTLVGNGQPGRISKLEQAVDDLKRARWTIGGAVLGISTTVTTIMHFVFK
jgi:hypothetical protein